MTVVPLLFGASVTRATILKYFSLLHPLYVRDQYVFYSVALPNFKSKFGSVTLQNSHLNPAKRILREILRISMYNTYIPLHSGFCDMGGQRIHNGGQWHSPQRNDDRLTAQRAVVLYCKIERYAKKNSRVRNENILFCRLKLTYRLNDRLFLCQRWCYILFSLPIDPLFLYLNIMLNCIWMMVVLVVPCHIIICFKQK